MAVTFSLYHLIMYTTWWEVRLSKALIISRIKKLTNMKWVLINFGFGSRTDQTVTYSWVHLFAKVIAEMAQSAVAEGYSFWLPVGTFLLMAPIF